MMWGKIIQFRSKWLYNPAVVNSLNSIGRPKCIVTKKPNSDTDLVKPKDKPGTDSPTTQTQSPGSASITPKENTTATTLQSQNVTAAKTNSGAPTLESCSTRPASSTPKNYPEVNGTASKLQGSITTSVPISSTTSQNQTSNTVSSLPKDLPTPESKPQDATAHIRSGLPKPQTLETPSSALLNNSVTAQTGSSVSQSNVKAATTVLPISHGQSSTPNAAQSLTFESNPQTVSNILSKPHIQSTNHAETNMTLPSPTSDKSPNPEGVKFAGPCSEKNVHHISSTATSSATGSSNMSPSTKIQSVLPQSKMNESPVSHPTSKTISSSSKLQPSGINVSQVSSKTPSDLPSKPQVGLQSKEQTKILQAPLAETGPSPPVPCIQSTASHTEVKHSQAAPSPAFTPSTQTKPIILNQEPTSHSTKDKFTTSNTKLNTSQVEPIPSNTQIDPQSQQHFPTSTTISVKQSNPVSSYSKPLLAKSATSNLRESQSFLMNLFLGVFKPDQVFPLPNILSGDQRETIQIMTNSVEKLFKNINAAAKNDKEENIPQKCLNALKEMGLFGLQVPQDLGGLGLNNTQYARLLEVIGGNDLALAISVGSHQSIGFRGILMAGTPEQRAKYLPNLSKGQQFAAFCLTEPSAGSDIKSINTKAVLSPDKKHYILNGRKLWVSNGGMCDVMTVFAKTSVTEKVNNRAEGLTAFIVERSFKGVSSDHPEKKLGIKASNTTQIFLSDVKVPVENVLGEIGGGYKLAMNILNNNRFSQGAALSGTMREVMKKTIEFAKKQEQFGNQISTYGTIQEKIARMAMQHYVTETITYLVSSNMDAGSSDYHMEAAVCKVFSSEATWKVTDEAIQIFGGMGYMHETGLEQILRDVRVFRIIEGTNEVLLHFIALHGLKHANIHMQELKESLKRPRHNFNYIVDQVRPHLLRAVGLNWAMTSSIKSHTHLALEQATKDTTMAIDHFSYTIALISLKYGKDITKEQFLLNRIAKAAIDIYASIAVLSRATDSLNKKLPSAQHELLMTQVWCDEANRRVVANMKAISLISNQKLNFHKMGQISKNVCESNGIVQQNPV